MQTVAPATANVPSEQATRPVPAGLGQRHPAAHTVQLLAPASAHVPGGHFTTMASTVLGHAVPATHGVQAAAAPVE